MNTVEQFLNKHPKYREDLEKILKYEKEHKEKWEEEKRNADEQKLPCISGFEWSEAKVNPSHLNIMLLGNIINQVYNSRSCTIYRLDNPEEIEEALSRTKTVNHDKIEISEDLFDIIEGYSDLKFIFKKALTTDKNIHILLVGKPATAKSLFLMDLERIGGRRILAGTSTKAGIRDVLFEKPQLLLIDEMDKVNSSKDLSSLLTWMEEGRIIATKYEYSKDETIDKCIVVGACNRTNGLPEELLSRFMVFYLKPYTRKQFAEAVMGVLTKREHADPEISKHITENLIQFGYTDVRDAIKLYRLADNKEDVDKILKIWEKYQD